LFGTTLLIVVHHVYRSGAVYTGPGLSTVAGLKAVMHYVKDSLFQVISIFTTTGYATRDISSPFFTALARQLFLLLMVIGGCAGSTGGGLKVVRVAILSRLVKRSLFQINAGRFYRAPVTIDRIPVEDDEVRRIAMLFFLWILLLCVGGGVTAFFSELNGWQSVSGMFSALGNIGPCYISVEQISHLHPMTKVTYILAMLAGRLELLPVFIIFRKRFFK
jgi:trk system potassium uptake protein TrkH